MKKINQLTVSFGLTALFAMNVSAENQMKYLEQSPEENAIYYYNAKTNIATEINVERWKSEFANNKTGDERFNLLRRLYAATTRLLKDNGERHAVCFSGSADELVAKFFAKEVAINGVEAVRAKASEDQKTIGITIYPEAKYVKMINKPYLHFRLNHCNEAGKNHYFDFKKAQVAKVLDFSRLPAAALENQMVNDERVAAAQDKDIKGAIAATEPMGFQILDKPSTEDLAKAKKLPRFKMRADYENMKVRETDRPWKGLDLSKEEDRMKFARTTLYYFFKGMADQSPKADFNFIAEKNKKADWCQMPWLNVGDSGREYVHGLTKERDLEPSNMYPDIEPASASDWGIGYYNSHGCVTLGKVFGGSKSRLEKPAFYEHKFENGTMSAKILFTTSKANYFDGSYTLMANVSTPGSNFRSLQPVRMLQIDIAVKDNEIKGTSPIADHWVMTSYYYDPTFTWDFANEFTSPAVQGLMHMRPIGTHTGFDSKTSFIFPGAKTNSTSETWGSDKLLNGPADNPKSSCMGCHGTAGGSYSGKYKMVPGILDFQMYEQFKLKRNMDFSQQLGFAKRNFDTQPQKK